MKKQFEVGDKVAVLDDAINGVVVALKENQIVVETLDGFTLAYSANELVKVENNAILSNISNKDILQKTSIDTQLTQKQKNVVNQLNKQERGVPEFDLHIEKLIKNRQGLSNFDILTIQLDTAKTHIEFAIRNRIPKIVLIHGVGDGVLKTELEYLYRKYDNISHQDGNYQKYGLGATEIYFKQNTK